MNADKRKKAIALINKARRSIGQGNIQEPCEILDRLRALIESSDWIPVSERLPEEREEVSVLYSDGVVSTNEIWNDEEKKYWSMENFIDSNITHWQPLPEPPEAKS